MTGWNGPRVNPEDAVGYDLEALEVQPRVKAGDWVKLPNGDPVCLRVIPEGERPPHLQVFSKDPVELLFYRWRGELFIGALNGRSLIGMPPLIATTRAALLGALASWTSEARNVE